MLFLYDIVIVYLIHNFAIYTGKLPEKLSCKTLVIYSEPVSGNNKA